LGALGGPTGPVVRKGPMWLWVIDFNNTHQFRALKKSKSTKRWFQIFDTISKSKESPGLGIWKKKSD